MTYEDFMKLNEDEQKAAWTSLQTDNESFLNMRAEIESFKLDNDAYIKENEKLLSELQKTKEMNFSLARKLNLGAEKKAPEDILHDMFSQQK